MSFEFLRLCEADVYDVRRIEEECFIDPYSIPSLDKVFSNKNNICYGAFENSVLEAYFICTTVLDEAELQRIAVTGSSRRKGLASSLMDLLIKECSLIGITNIFLEVREGNTSAKNLYKKFNFIKTGLRKGYYRDNGENAILYTLSVNGR